MSEELLSEMERLKEILIARATGDFPDEQEYRELRKKFISNTSIRRKLLPEFIFNCRTFSDYWGFIKEKSDTYQGRRDFLRDAFADVLLYLEEQSLYSTPIDEVVLMSISNNNIYSYVQENWKRAIDRRNNDPEGAITMARTLLETTCKHILDQAGESYNDSDDLPQLYSKIKRLLNLAPSEHTEKIFKQILGGCVSIVNGLGSIRNKVGDAHGKGIIGPKPSPRHAQLAVNTAGAMAEFLIATWEEKVKREN